MKNNALQAVNGAAFSDGVVVNSPSSGRWVATGKLTKKQRRFAELVAEGVPHTRAAAEAGYHSGRDGWRLLRTPHVAAFVRQEAAARVLSEGAAVSVSVLLEVATDKAQSGAARVSAARTIAQMAGFLAKDGARGDAVDDRPLSERSIAELEEGERALVALIEAEKRRRGIIDSQAVPDMPTDAPRALVEPAQS